MRRIFIFVICCMCAFTTYAQQYKLYDFLETKLPRYLSKEWLVLNNAPISFKVSVVDNKLTINKDERHGQAELAIGDGKLIGLNHGEWGGALMFKRKSSQTDTIKSGNIVDIFKFQNQTYFLEGLAHMSFNFGALYKLDNKGARFTYTKILDFKDAPQSSVIVKDQILIAGFNNFYIVKNGKIETIFKEVFWDLYPNSIAAINDSDVYVGIRGGLIKLNIINKKSKFFRYKDL